MANCCEPNTTLRTDITLIGQIIDQIRDTAAITDITDNLNSTALIETPNTFDLVVVDAKELNPYIKIGGETFKVIAVVENVSFTVEFTTLPVGTTWINCAPYYYFGHLRMIANEISKILDKNQAYPAIIFNSEITSTAGNRDPISVVDQIRKVQLFFVDQSNYEDFDIQDFYDNVLDRLEQLCVDWDKAADKNRFVGSLNDITFTRQRVSKWGVNFGRNQETIFNNNLSAVIYQTDLPILKDYQTFCDCTE